MLICCDFHQLIDNWLIDSMPYAHFLLLILFQRCLLAFSLCPRVPSLWWFCDFLHSRLRDQPRQSASCCSLRASFTPGSDSQQSQQNRTTCTASDGTSSWTTTAPSFSSSWSSTTRRRRTITVCFSATRSSWSSTGTISSSSSTTARNSSSSSTTAKTVFSLWCSSARSQRMFVFRMAWIDRSCRTTRCLEAFLRWSQGYHSFLGW